MIIAIRAAAIIISDSNRSDDAVESGPKSTLTMPVVYPAFATKSFRKGALDPYMPSLCEFISQLIHSLDVPFGNLLLHNQTKPIADIIQKEKLPSSASLLLLRTCISFIPLAVPSGMSVNDLFSNLSRYVVHVDVDLREIGSKTLARLMERFPPFRPAIIHSLAEVRTPSPTRVGMSSNDVRPYYSSWCFRFPIESVIPSCQYCIWYVKHLVHTHTHTHTSRSVLLLPMTCVAFAIVFTLDLSSLASGNKCHRDTTTSNTGIIIIIIEQWWRGAGRWHRWCNCKQWWSKQPGNRRWHCWHISTISRIKRYRRGWSERSSHWHEHRCKCSLGAAQ